eukprot:TRINITY_DN38271_c0_g1_i1.p3 TRINITY_DN38271_c0_g1~~TRINITY_DN38271_c0_g1_i1.p3  ORF type:complete len:113 (-),score=8.98 TRINITY_DN38271_c0_g1_i1:5-343(-)
MGAVSFHHFHEKAGNILINHRFSLNLDKVGVMISGVEQKCKETYEIATYCDQSMGGPAKLVVYFYECLLKQCSVDQVWHTHVPVSYTHLRAHETGRNLVCRLLLEKKKKNQE